MDDIKIIDLFFARSELAIEALDGKYGAICHNLSRSILKDDETSISHRACGIAPAACRLYSKARYIQSIKAYRLLFDRYRPSAG